MGADRASCARERRYDPGCMVPSVTHLGVRDPHPIATIFQSAAELHLTVPREDRGAQGDGPLSPPHPHRPEQAGNKPRGATAVGGRVADINRQLMHPGRHSRQDASIRWPRQHRDLDAIEAHPGAIRDPPEVKHIVAGLGNLDLRAIDRRP